MGRHIEFDPNESLIWKLAFLGFSDNQIAAKLGCHHSLIYRRHDIKRALREARAERDKAIVALWLTSSRGVLSSDEADGLMVMIRDAAAGKIHRRSPEQRKISGDRSGFKAQRKAVRAREERKSEGQTASGAFSDGPTEEMGSDRKESRGGS